MFKCSNACIPRKVPHPGHSYPVKTKNGHLGKKLISDGLKKYKNIIDESPSRTKTKYRMFFLFNINLQIQINKKYGIP